MKFKFLTLPAACCCCLLLQGGTSTAFAQEKPEAPPATAAAPKSLAIPATDDDLPGAGPLRRAEWFQKLWLERRAQFAKETARDQQTVVFLGDSITQGWGDDLSKVFPGLKAANRGISGDTTRGMLVRLHEDVLALNPRAVVLLMGTNDLEEKAAPETIAENLELILTELEEHDPKLPVILCQILPSAASKARPADLIRQTNKLFAEVVKSQPQVTLVETWPLFADAAGDAKPDEFPDLLHPNEAGYRKWAAALRPVLATLGFLETEPDDFKPEEGFVSLFNGRDLTGWSLETKDSGFEPCDGKTLSSDNRYLALNGRLIVTTPPEGRKISKLQTVQTFPGNFTLKLEFRATPNADSGVFIRSPQLQCRDYELAGPWKNLTKYKPQEWNEIIAVIKDGIAHCTCNGEVLEAAFKLPADGPIGLEGDSGQMEYRRIRLRKE